MKEAKINVNNNSGHGVSCSVKVTDNVTNITIEVIKWKNQYS